MKRQMKLYVSKLKPNRPAELPDNDYNRLKRCDALLLPHGWQNDRRCREEKVTAEWWKKEIFEGSVINEVLCVN